MPYSSERYPVSTDIDDNKNKIREDLSKRKDEWDKRVSENGYAEKILKKDISNTASEPKEPAPKKTPAVKSAGVLQDTPSALKGNNALPISPENTKEIPESKDIINSRVQSGNVPNRGDIIADRPIKPSLEVPSKQAVATNIKQGIGLSLSAPEVPSVAPSDKMTKTGAQNPDTVPPTKNNFDATMQGMKGEFWDKVRNKERNHNFDTASLQEFSLDRQAQDSLGIQRNPNKPLSEKQELALQQETERLRKESGLPPSTTNADRMYFIDKNGKRQLDLNYLKSRGYNPVIDANIPGAVLLSPNLTPGDGMSLEERNFAQEAPHAQEALKRVDSYLKSDPGLQKMITEVSDITGAPVLIGGIGIRTSGKYNFNGVNMPLRAPNDSYMTETMSDVQRDRNNKITADLWRSSGFNGDMNRFHNSRDFEQGALFFAQGGANKETVRNEVGELWMSARELQDRGSTGVNSSTTTQIATWHTDKALSMTENGYTKTKSQPDSPEFWRGFADNFQASEKIHGEGISNFYTSHHKGQKDVLVGDTEKQTYASNLYNQRLAYFYNIPVEKVPLNWKFESDDNGKIRAIPTLKE